MARMPCAGELRHRVHLEVARQTRDEIGGMAEDWLPVATLWAAVEQLSARERWHRSQIGAVASWRVTIRWRAGIDTTQRLIWQGRTLEITGVDDIEQRRQFLALLCDERLPAAAPGTTAPITPAGPPDNTIELRDGTYLVDRGGDEITARAA